MNTSHKKSLMIAAAIIVLAVAFAMLPKRQNNADETEPPNGNTAASTQKDEKKDVKKPGKADRKDVKGQKDEDTISQHAAERIKKLQILMDNIDIQAENALKLAQEMSSGENEERHEAIQVFLWVGGKDSRNALLTMMSDNNKDIAEEAKGALTHLIQQNLFEDQRLMDAESWMALLKNDKTPEAIDETMGLLTSFEVPDYMPVVLNMMDSEIDAIKQAALDAVESIAYKKFETKEEASKWYQQYLAEQQQEE